MTNEIVISVVISLFFGLFLGAGAVGALAFWLTQGSRTLVADLRAKLADAGARLDETRGQLDHAKTESHTLNGTLRKYEAAWTGAKTKLEEKEKHLRDQKALVEQAKIQLSDSFKAIAAQALAMNNRGFLDLAEEKFKGIKTEATAELEARKGAIESLVKPVSETLAVYQQVTSALEERRQKDMGAIGEQLRAVASNHATLQIETNRLVNALKTPQVRGRWGEVALKRIAELAGMTPHCDFTEQESVSTLDGKMRPDMIVKLPSNRDVIVDSKVPIQEFMNAIESPTDEHRFACLQRHADHVANHVARLAAKEYWGELSTSLDFVVLFIPNDSFLAAATDKKPDLVEYALGKKIVLASPTTLFALLRALEYAWQQHRAVENAHEIRDLGQQLSDRFSTLVEHLNKVGGSLGKAVESFNAAISSVEKRLFLSARRFKELGAGGKKDIEEVQVVDARPRGRLELNEQDTAED